MTRRRGRSSTAAERPVVAGVAISHPDRIVFPAAQATKLDLARYYQSISDWALPHLLDRPLTLVHCANGVPRAGVRRGVDCVFMKHAKVWGPAPIRRVRIREKTKVGEYLVVDSLPALIGLVQMGVVEIHTWNSRIGQVEHPDRIVVDLDPGEEVEWRTVADAARLVRDLLHLLDLESFAKTTGGRGLHLVVPLTPGADWSECLDFTRAFARALARRRPDLFTDRFARAGRGDLILVDYLRNNRTNTSIAAYSTRAKPDAPVSTPIAWRELSASRPPARFTMTKIRDRLARLEVDPWRGYWTAAQRMPRGGIRALERL